MEGFIRVAIINHAWPLGAYRDRYQPTFTPLTRFVGSHLCISFLAWVGVQSQAFALSVHIWPLLGV